MGSEEEWDAMSEDYAGSEDYEYELGGSDLDEDDYAAGTSSPVKGAQAKAKFTIMGREEMREKAAEEVGKVVDLLCISEAEATRVLRFYKWDAARLQEDWFEDADRVREKVGMVDEKPSTRRKEVTCQICFESYPVSAMPAARCKHYYCKDCWQGYVHAAIEGGPAVLDLRCPDPQCKAAVPQTIVREVADAEHLAKYDGFALSSFVDDNRRLAWCPAPGCENAAMARSDPHGEPLDIFCRCGATWCFTCKEEAHRPVDCETVRQWMIKNSAESENMNWILANTKPCPKCTRPIEKNQGCMHMTCSQCRFEFCWLCLGPWAEHGERTGGFYNCNTYKRAKEKGEIDEAEQQRQHARASLERYMHYWQRWAENDKARKQALKQLKKFTDEKMEALSERTHTPTSQLRFVTDAFLQVVDCRRILKWTYAVGYYQFAEVGAPLSSSASKEEREAAARLEQLKQFFEFNQGQAEHYLEALHHKVEKDLLVFLKDREEQPAAAANAAPSGPAAAAAASSGPPEDWALFRQQLIGLTDVTRAHFEKLVNEFEKGLEVALGAYTASSAAADVDMAGPSTSSQADAAAAPAADEGASTRAAGRRTLRSGKRARGGANARGKSPAAEDDAPGAPDEELEKLAGFWQCGACTYCNSNLQAQTCEMCGRPRQRGAGK